MTQTWLFAVQTYFARRPFVFADPSDTNPELKPEDKREIHEMQEPSEHGEY